MQKLTDAGERLSSEIERQKQAGLPLRERLLFEELLSAISARFINLSYERIDAGIHNAMQEILNFFKVDRFALLRTLPDRNSWIITHSVSVAGMPAVPVGVDLPVSIHPWAYEKLIMKREVLSFSKIDDLPKEANVDKKTWIAWGIRSNLIIPIMIGGPADHIIAINSIKCERAWPEDFVPRLRLLGEIFVNAIERSKAQKDLQESEERQQTELQLNWSQTLLDTLINSSSDMIWAVDSEHFGLLTFNGSLSEYFLHHRGIHIEAGMRPENLFTDDEYIQRWRSFYQRALEEGSFTTEYLVYAGNRILQLNLNILKYDGRVLGVSVFGQDITEFKGMENQLREQLAVISKLKSQLEKENIYLRDEIKAELGVGKIIGDSDTLQYVLFRSQQVAPTDATVLILGETGVGKGMVARAIHEMSTRKGKAMVTVNCAALPANLIESELFGREKGAFTGAHARQAGRFEVADGGTIFLDEIGELPLELQTKLLRVLQDGEFERLGSPRTVKVDVRVIASTSRDLKAEMRNGRFREDLYYRLNTFPVTLPPLRMRVEDIPGLTRYFIDKYAHKFGKRFETISKDTMQMLQGYYWPGNVRELEHVIERAVITSPEPVFQLADQLEQEPVKVEEGAPKGFESMAREHILQVLQKTGWKIEGEGGAAAILGLNPSTLRFRIKKLGLKRP